MYAFRAGLNVPPFLAVPSRKRILTGLLTDQQVLDIIYSLKPEQVLLIRFEWPLLDNFLDQNYRFISFPAGKKLYILNK
jgi:hypothetical protein